MAYTVGDICTEVGLQLNDSDFVTYPKTTVLYPAINSGLLAIVAARPDSSSVTENIALAAGVKQTLPTGGYKFLNMTRNMGVDAGTPGKVIRRIKRSVFDEVLPNWPAENTSLRIEHFIFDDESPRTFHVYPAPEITTLNVEIVYSKVPTLINGDSNALSVSDVFVPALTEWVLYKALSIEQDGAGMSLANQHLQAFYMLLGLKKQADQVASQVQEAK